MPDTFTYDVFLSHSSKDKDVVRPIAEQLKADGVRVWFDEWEIKPGDSIPAKIEDGLECSRVLVFCMSANAFGSDWAQLESGTFRFRDPLNKERRFIPLRLDDAPIKGSLAQFLYVDWVSLNPKKQYSKLLEACSPLKKAIIEQTQALREIYTVRSIRLDSKEPIYAYAFSPDGKYALSGGERQNEQTSQIASDDADKTFRLWDVSTGKCLCVFKDCSDRIDVVEWSIDQRRALSGSHNKTIQLWDIESGNCLRVFEGHSGIIMGIAWSPDQQFALSASFDNTIRQWDIETGVCLRVLSGHTERVRSVAWSANQRYALSGADDNMLRLWDLESGRCLQVLTGHTYWVLCVAFSADQRLVLSGSCDNTMRLWDIETGRCVRVFEGHTANVASVTWSLDQRYAISGSADNTVRLWDIESGRCLQVLHEHKQPIEKVVLSADQRHVFSGDIRGIICLWNISDFINRAQQPAVITTNYDVLIEATQLDAYKQVQYTNAKVLLVGDTSSGKTGLAHRLATGEWVPSGGSTVGAWSTQWALPGIEATTELDREIWLWDFGGQADQRLVHQLYMDHTAMILLLFDADKEDVLPGLRDWQSALRRCVPENAPLLLVAGRIDAGFRASREKLKRFADEQGFKYFETSAQDGTGCNELIQAITEGIPWEQMEQRTSPRIFKLIKDQILKLRDDGQVLHTFKELRDLLWQRMTDEPRFSDDILKTVISLLDGPGAVKELEYGTYILLQPEWINAYAQAVIRTLRQEPSELGCLPLQSIAEGKLIFQTVERDGSILEMKRLPEAEERVVLREMERQMEERRLCLRQGDKLVFPSHCGRERPEVVAHPSVFMSYVVKGYLDDIYATLVVKLADSDSFKLRELWRDAADFDTLADACRMGVKLMRNSSGAGEIMVYFGPGVTQGEQIIFANYIHAHLDSCCEDVKRLRHYVCPKCNTPKGNSQVLMDKLLAKKQNADTECDKCGERFALWDTLEQRFASDDVRERVEGLQFDDVIRLDTRRKGKLLALEVMARISSADQKCFEIPGTEDEGLDVELEFTDDGAGTGRRLYLQLKSGNSHLRLLKNGKEMFDIKEQRWVEYWLKQPHPVMLVVGTFVGEEEGFTGREKLEFAEVRWMEISSELKRLSANGTKAVKSFEFKGERLDMDSINRWRSRMLAS